MKKFIAIICLLCTGLVTAGGNQTEGKKIAEQVCKSCHGLDGQGIDATYPKLAGQFQSYMAQALKDYRSGDRSNIIMAGFSASLSDQEIEDVAAFYANIKEGRLHDLSIK